MRFEGLSRWLIETRVLRRLVRLGKLRFGRCSTGATNTSNETVEKGCKKINLERKKKGIDDSYSSKLTGP